MSSGVEQLSGGGEGPVRSKFRNEAVAIELIRSHVLAELRGKEALVCSSKMRVAIWTAPWDRSIKAQRLKFWGLIDTQDAS